MFIPHVPDISKASFATRWCLCVLLQQSPMRKLQQQYLLTFKLLEYDLINLLYYVRIYMCIGCMAI